MSHEEIINFVVKYTSYFFTAVGFMVTMYKFIMRGIEKKFATQHEFIKSEIMNMYNGTIKTVEARLDYLTEDATKIGCIVGVNTAEAKTICESVARLEATCQAMQRTCEHNHSPWDGITERRRYDRG